MSGSALNAGHRGVWREGLAPVLEEVQGPGGLQTNDSRHVLEVQGDAGDEEKILALVLRTRTHGMCLEEKVGEDPGRGASQGTVHSGSSVWLVWSKQGGWQWGSRRQDRKGAPGPGLS